MKEFILVILSIFAIFIVLSNWSCKHSPVGSFDDDMMPIDTIPDDTIPQGDPCEPDVIYFDRDVLPIFISNCAFSGCHDANTAEDGVVLDSYENVFNTGDIDPFDPGSSDVYKMITDEDNEDRMPPPPAARLSQDQIAIIRDWILQGAENLECDPGLEGCETTNVSFAATVNPIIVTHCQGCHSGGSPSGGIDLTTHGGVSGVANNGRLVGAITWAQGYVNMPQGGNQLPDCEIAQIESWVDAGAPNN